jgi:Tfp pilus assembly protein FimT
MGIMMAIAATNFGAMRPSLRTRAAALAVAGDMNQARMSAVKEGLVYDYFPIAGGYQIRRDNGVGGRTVLKQVVIGTQYPQVTFGHTGIPNDPYAVAIAASSPGATITFHSDGTVQNAAGVFLQANGYDGPVQQAVTLSSGGRVRIWKYVGAAWQ